MVGNRLKDLRVKSGLSKSQMANMLLMQIGTYEGIEQNKTIPDETEIKWMATQLSIPEEYLLMGQYDIFLQENHTHLCKTANGWTCTEEFCGWRQNCGDGVFYCPGKGCMKEWEERHGTENA